MKRTAGGEESSGILASSSKRQQGDHHEASKDFTVKPNLQYLPNVAYGIIGQYLGCTEKVMSATKGLRQPLEL